jgi:signal transduction histidine kinase
MARLLAPLHRIPLALQLVMVIVTSVAVVNVLAFTTLLDERTGALSQVLFRDVVARTAPTLQAFARTGEVARPADPMVSVNTGPPVLHKGRSGDEVERMLEAAIPPLDIGVSIRVDTTGTGNRPQIPSPIIQVLATRPDGRTLLLDVTGPPVPVFPIVIVLTTLLYGMLVCAGGIWIVTRLTRPLSDLARGAEALGREKLDGLIEERGPVEVRAVASSFNAMAIRLRALVGRQRATLWALGHDLRTPLTAMRLRIELMGDEEERATMLAAWEEIDRVADDALWLARAGSSEQPLERSDLATLAERAIGTLKGSLQPDQAARLETPAGAGVEALVRETEVARAIRNLAENALRHGRGPVRIVIDRDSAGCGRVTIFDHGDGFPATLLTTGVTAFQRGDAARHTPGTGLGLSIAKAVAEGHGGRLKLANSPGGGASAALTFPA